MAERDVLKQRPHGIALGYILFKEFHSCRSVEKQIPYYNGRAVGAACLLARHVVSAA